MLEANPGEFSGKPEKSTNMNKKHERNRGMTSLIRRALEGGPLLVVRGVISPTSRVTTPDS